MLKKAINTIVILCFHFLQAGFNRFFISRMNVEEILVEKLQRRSKKKLQKLKEE
jgi:hypothetical protein